MSPDVIARRFADLLDRPAVRRLAAASRGIPCHLVGGAVRDHALGRSPRDLDAVVRSDGRRIAESLAATLPARLVELGGDRFAAFRLVAQDLEIDIWDREEASLDADLDRRDLTINSCAVDVVTGVLVDPLGGMADLAAGRLRASSPRAFELDPLRVLRLPRFVAELAGFSVEPATGVLARRSAAGLAHVAVERIREELELLFSRDGFAAAIPWLVELRLHPGLWLGEPGRIRLQSGYPATAARLEELLPRAREVAPITFAGGAAGAVALDRTAARLAIACHALAESGQTSGDLHSRVEAVEKSRKSGLLRRPVATAAVRLLAGPENLGEETERRWYLHRLGPLWREGLCCHGAVEGADPASRDWDSSLTELTRLARDHGEEIFNPPVLLAGDEVAAAVGLEPGPDLGRWIRRLRRRQIEGSLRTREAALEWLSGARSSGSPSGAD